jgi:UDP-N-acetylmuramoyl-L-alanyl-D-glutamate--2,6-diaminopimelate ligase
MENYLKAKLMILDHLKDNAVILVNKDDEKHTYFKKEGHKVLTFGYKADYEILDYEIDPAETKLRFKYDNNEYNVTIPLTNMFNIYNYLTMLSIVNNCGFSIDDIIKHTSELKAPKGRCEVYKVKEGYAVIDYAHTPDAEEKVIKAYNELKKNRVITLIGCGGNRDAKKRPIMGNIATTLSDYTIFTSDNPREEDPNEIINDILKGVKTKDNYEVVIDRKEAIKRALDIMEKDDILLLLGKGHENYQVIGREKIHLDDAEEVLKYKESH